MQGGHRIERIHPAEKAHLGLVDVPDAGDHALIEERLGDPPRLLASKPLDGRVDVERRREQVGPELPERRVPRHVACTDELRDGHVERDGRVGVGLEHDSHLRARAAPAFAGAVHVPRSVHAHMGAEHQIP